MTSYYTGGLNRERFLPGIHFTKKPRDARVIYFANDYDVTSSGLKGANKAPAAIKQCLECQIEPRERNTGINLMQQAKFHWFNPGTLNKLSPAEMVKRVERDYESLLSSRKNDPPFIVMVGGDHSSPIGVFRVLARRWNPRDITLLHIDAHFDLRDIDEFRAHPYGKEAHCSVLRRAAELGFRIVSVGIRDYSDEELKYALQHKNQISFFEMGRDKHWSIASAISAIKTKNVYFTIDVDGFDPSVFPITGTPVPGGISWDDGVSLLMRAVKKHTLIGADINEAAVSASEPFATYRTIFSAAKLAYLIPCLAIGSSKKSH